jgi:peptidoglycan/xylan/chitin deacetylase (PgdA/CDA1 family)
MGVGHLRRARLSATLVLLAAGLDAACTGTAAPGAVAAGAAAPAARARSAVPTPPSVTLTTGYTAINEGTVNPVTVTVRFPVAITSDTLGLTGAKAPHCTPLVLSANRTSGTSTCWNTSGSPGTATLLATATLAGRGRSATLWSAPVPVTVTRRRAPDVPVATYTRTYSCGNDSPYVWLTFDDYGSTAQVRSILATLRRNDAKALMFPVGTWARANPSLISAMKHDGQVIDNHTATHADLSSAAASTVLREIDNGARPSTSVRLLRPPGGAGAFSTRLTALAASRGYSLCFWTVDTRDWAGTTTSQMVRKVRYGDAMTPPVEPGGVILMHFHGRHTAAGLQSVINAVRVRGLRLQPLH